MTPWTGAHQAPLSLEFSRQEHGIGLPCPSPGDFPDPGIKPWSLALQADSLLFELPRSLTDFYIILQSVYLWQIHFDIWQNQYNIVKLNKIKLKKKKKKDFHSGQMEISLIFTKIHSNTRQNITLYFCGICTI